MDRKKDIIKCINSISGKYSSYEVFSDWIKCSSLFISNKFELFHGEVWNGRERAYIESMARIGITITKDQIVNSFFHEMFHSFNFMMNNEQEEVIAQSFANFMCEFLKTAKYDTEHEG